MATSRRFLVSKTYGESSDCSSSKAFDEAMKIKPRSTFNKINIQAASTVSKWGKMTFTSTKISSVDHKLDSRKREFANEPEDPFSFEPEFSPCKIKRTEPATPLLAKFSSSENTVVDVRRKVEVDEVLHPSNNIKITNTGNISLDTKRKFYKSKNSANNNTEIKLKIKLNQPLESPINEYSINHEDSIELTSASHYNKVDHKPVTNNNVYKYNPDRFVDQPKQKFTPPSLEDKTAIKKKCIDIFPDEKIYETDCNSNNKHSATGNNYAHQKVIKNTNKNTVTNDKSADLNIKTDSTNKFADTKNTRNNAKFDKKTSQKKAKYKYRMWHEDDNEKDDVIDEDVDEDFPVFKKPSSSTYTKTNCQEEEPCTQESNNQQTQVVRDVKQAHECQESGETQEFEDDIEFIMDGLNPKQKLSISALSLLSKCTSSVFRMHLRAHGTLSQVFKSLSDAPDCPALSLCVACLFFLMSRDRLFVDMERSSYELMLKLLDVDDSISTSLSTSNKSSSTTTQISNTSTTQSNNNAPVKKALFFKSKHSKKSNANEDYDDVQRKVFNICCSSQHQQQQQQQQSSDKALFDLTLEQTMVWMHIFSLKHLIA
ncbi:hypothetical protein HELRODRAFT_160697 [Helobdella robusta]|uniref:WAPL domain-containing protein n=1 Tax=Helobdella robusta TaxID=6412 RepID=T1EQM2_HELRO|nr:hypothetical protein HELRODRAFT_160697 [Helobdella robusta]ESO06517.1 hypothetical protein HELRODRAFT_160697 [Helobdella robusta]